MTFPKETIVNDSYILRPSRLFWVRRRRRRSHRLANKTNTQKKDIFVTNENEIIDFFSFPGSDLLLQQSMQKRIKRQKENPRRQRIMLSFPIPNKNSPWKQRKMLKKYGWAQRGGGST